VEIFDWNSEFGVTHHVVNIPDVTKTLDGKSKKVERDKNGNFKEIWMLRKEIYKNTHCSWKINRFILEWTCLFTGWCLLFFVISTFLKLLADDKPDIKNLWNLLLTLIMGLVGFFGRLPSVIESVQSWFKK
jgi:hypothetical protein